MLRIRQAITITQVPTSTDARNAVLYFPFVNEFKIERTFDNQTQTAVITLPRNLKYQDKNLYAGVNPLILRGDKVKIECGYYPTFTEVFSGYVSKVDNNIPVQITCEDEMFLLKQKIVKKLSYTEVSLDTLLKDMIGSTVKYTNIKAQLGKVRIQSASIAYVLNKLRNEYGLFSFFQNGVLKVGTPYYEAKKVETFLFERVIIEDDLTYLRSEDVKIRINGVLIASDNTRTEKVYGDLDGDLRTIFQYGGTVAELDRLCKQKLSELNYTGYYGSFTTFLEPAMNPSDQAIINSYKMPERNGTYLIKSVDTMCGVNGGRQKIELERRLL